MTDEAIIAKYQEINQAIDKLGKRLITKLSKYGVEKDHESFTNLIHSIDEIEAIEKYYNNNTKPIEPDLANLKNYKITKDNYDIFYNNPTTISGNINIDFSNIENYAGITLESIDDKNLILMIEYSSISGFYLVSESSTHGDTFNSFNFDTPYFTIEKRGNKTILNNSNELDGEYGIIVESYVQENDFIKIKTISNLIEYNDSLIQKIIFYIKLLKYYLALKGINLNYVNNANTVVELIELIDFIDTISTTSLTITNTVTEYYTDEDIEISYILTDEKENKIREGYIKVYDGDMLVQTIQAGLPISIKLSTGEHTIKVQYEGTQKYKPSENYYSFIVKPGKIQLDVLIANQTESSLYYRSADTGFNNDKWYIKIITNNTKGDALPNVPLIIKDTILDDEGEVQSSTLLTNASITNDDGIYIIQNVNFTEYGEHTISIETQYPSEDISDDKEYYAINVAHDFYYNQYPFMIYYEGQTQNPIVIELHNEYGEKPYDENTNKYLLDNTITSLKIINILSDEIVYQEEKMVQNGEIELNINLPVGYYHIIVDTVIDLSINYADIHFNMEEYSITLPNLTFGINDEVIFEKNAQSSTPEENETDHGYIETTDDDINSDDYNETNKYHVYGLFIIDVRENLNLIKNATDNNGNIQISTTDILSAINNEDTNFIKSLTLSNDIISSESITVDNNKTIDSNLEEAIGKIYLNDDKNIEYETVGDIYSLDNRRLQYNKQQG